MNVTTVNNAFKSAPQLGCFDVIWFMLLVARVFFFCCLLCTLTNPCLQFCIFSLNLFRPGACRPDVNPFQLDELHQQQFGGGMCSPALPALCPSEQEELQQQ